MSLVPVKNESRGQRTPQFAQGGQGSLSALVASNFKRPLRGDTDFDLIARLQLKCIHDGCWQTDG
jgi:hypothetical protein